MSLRPGGNVPHRLSQRKPKHPAIVDYGDHGPGDRANDGSESPLAGSGSVSEKITGSYADLASAPSIMSTVFLSPYTATNEPKRGPFSWPSSTW